MEVVVSSGDTPRFFFSNKKIQEISTTLQKKADANSVPTMSQWQAIGLKKIDFFGAENWRKLRCEKRMSSSLKWLCFRVFCGFVQLFTPCLSDVTLYIQYIVVFVAPFTCSPPNQCDFVGSKTRLQDDISWFGWGSVLNPDGNGWEWMVQCKGWKVEAHSFRDSWPYTVIIGKCIT